jgi:CRISPR-associated protein Cmr6
MRDELVRAGVPQHLGLAYGSWAPSGDVSDGWLSKVADIPISDDYAHAFVRWKASFTAPGDRTAELTLNSRLLVGHGNPSPTDVGLTVHHTWGAPIIPGSALKGLLAHYVEATLGPDDMSVGPAEHKDEDRDRAYFRGVTWKDRRIVHGPGPVYRELFGAPDADDDAIFRQNQQLAGASKGRVTFHDALYVPRSNRDDRPFVVDVLTVHQARYYQSLGAHFPCDYDDPIPVQFLTVRPRAKFLLALSGEPEWTELAASLLSDALHGWGAGGKTAAGYGHGSAGPWSSPPSRYLSDFVSWLDKQQSSNERPWRSILREMKEQFREALAHDLTSNEFVRVEKMIINKFKGSVVKERDDFLKEIKAARGESGK